MTLEAVLFDLDGTLIDTAPDMVAAANRLRVEQGHPPMEYDELRPQVSNGARALVCTALHIDERHPRFSEFRQQFLDYYGEDIATYGSALFDGFARLLKQLERMDIPWGIVTNKPEKFAKPLLKALKLEQACKVLVCPEHVSETKPNPEPIFLACNQLGTDPGRTIYVGDHLRDIQAGLLAGSPTVGALFGYIEDAQEAEDWHADYLIERPQDLWPIIQTYL